MNRFFLSLALLTFACGGGSEPEAPDAPEAGPILLVSQKAAKSVAWYTLDGELLHEVSVSDHPHEIARRGNRLRGAECQNRRDQTGHVA